MEDVLEILYRLKAEQFPIGHEHAGNVPSTRYHTVFPVSREEDNVYFISWICQCLRRYRHLLSPDELREVDEILLIGKESILKYRNRYGGPSYNFYRPKEWFPNGRILSRFRRFQPTDDADDTAIAYRGWLQESDNARAVKDLFLHQSNKQRGRRIARCPKAYRDIPFYNTWIGSEGLFIDMDVMVLCNVLTFNAQYDLGIKAQDQASCEVIKRAFLTRELFDEPWSLACWYPFEEVLLYGLADLLNLDYYPSLSELRPWLENELESRQSSGFPKGAKGLLLRNSILKTRLTDWDDLDSGLEEIILESTDFTFGVIPITHPWNGRFSQWLGGQSIFRMHYRCDAQVIALYWEYAMLHRERLMTS